AKVAVGDFNGDGSPDLAAANYDDINRIGSVDVRLNQSSTSHFVISGLASSTDPQILQSFTVTAEDSAGRILTNYSGTIRFGSSDMWATLPGEAVLSNGVGTFSAAFRSAGN